MNSRANSHPKCNDVEKQKDITARSERFNPSTRNGTAGSPMATSSSQVPFQTRVPGVARAGVKSHLSFPVGDWKLVLWNRISAISLWALNASVWVYNHHAPITASITAAITASRFLQTFIPLPPIG